MDLRSSPLDICCLGEFAILCVHDLCKPSLEASLSGLCNWGLNLHSIYSHCIYLVYSALCVLRSSELQNPEVTSIPTVLPKSGTSRFANPEVPGLADSVFNPLYLSEKFVDAPIHPL